MLKVALILLALTIILVPRYPVYAQTAATRSAVAPSPKLPTAVQRAADRLTPTALPKEEKIASRGALLKAKLAKFRDQKKARLVERIDNNLASINATRSAIMAQKLVILTSILDRLDAKIIEAANRGQDMSTPQSAVTQARSAVTAAQAAVDAQKLEEYVVEATSEATIKQEIMNARTSLHTDLNNVHGMIVQARQTVANAISTTVSALKGGNGGSQ